MTKTGRPESETTRAVVSGRGAPGSGGGVHPPIQRASTLLLDRAEDLYRDDIQTYGLEGMEAHRALKAALLDIEGGAACALAPSGLAACTLAFLAATRAGAHVLIPDSVYGPTRRFADTMGARFGVSATYYDPRIAAGIESLIRPETTLIWLESPGSLTFEVQDVPAIASVARKAGVATAIDNTWSAGVYFKPFAHGVDLSIQALTKYQAGHADVLAGAVLSADKEWGARIGAAYKQLGLGLGVDDAYQCLRGLKTMHLRMARHDASARALAAWLESHPSVAQVLHPALPGSPDHALWARDFSGAGGLFGVRLKPCSTERLNAMLNGLTLFKMGFSWGGFESLIIPCDQQLKRLGGAGRAGPLIRLQVGLEDVEDLRGDLQSGLDSLLD
jgi:cysteine-S-conjugate beta-lyase